MNWHQFGNDWVANGFAYRTYRVRPINHAGTYRVTKHERSGKCTGAQDVPSLARGRAVAEGWERER